MMYLLKSLLIFIVPLFASLFFFADLKSQTSLASLDGLYLSLKYKDLSTVSNTPIVEYSYSVVEIEQNIRSSYEKVDQKLSGLVPFLRYNFKITNNVRVEIANESKKSKRILESTLVDLKCTPKNRPGSITIEKGSSETLPGIPLWALKIYDCAVELSSITDQIAEKPKESDDIKLILKGNIETEINTSLISKIILVFFIFVIYFLAWTLMINKLREAVSFIKSGGKTN